MKQEAQLLERSWGAIFLVTKGVSGGLLGVQPQLIFKHWMLRDRATASSKSLLGFDYSTYAQTLGPQLVVSAWEVLEPSGIEI